VGSSTRGCAGTRGRSRPSSARHVPTEFLARYRNQTLQMRAFFVATFLVRDGGLHHRRHAVSKLVVQCHTSHFYSSKVHAAVEGCKGLIRGYGSLLSLARSSVVQRGPGALVGLHLWGWCISGVPEGVCVRGCHLIPKACSPRRQQEITHTANRTHNKHTVLVNDGRTAKSIRGRAEISAELHAIFVRGSEGRAGHSPFSPTHLSHVHSQHLAPPSPS